MGKRVDGLVLITAAAADAELARLLAVSRLPRVVVDREIEGLSANAGCGDIALANGGTGWQ